LYITKHHSLLQFMLERAIVNVGQGPFCVSLAQKSLPELHLKYPLLLGTKLETDMRVRRVVTTRSKGAFAPFLDTKHNLPVGGLQVDSQHRYGNGRNISHLPPVAA